jgi:hypothetical protein
MMPGGIVIADVPGGIMYCEDWLHFIEDEYGCPQLPDEVFEDALVLGQDLFKFIESGVYDDCLEKMVAWAGTRSDLDCDLASVLLRRKLRRDVDLVLAELEHQGGGFVEDLLWRVSSEFFLADDTTRAYESAGMRHDDELDM